MTGQTIVPIAVFAMQATATVVGQLLLKHAMECSRVKGFGRPPTLKFFIGGVSSLTIAFFLMIGLLQHFDLSFFYPIQGSTAVIIAIAATIFLREKLSPQLIIGSLLISAGIVLVSLS
ncbi:MAG TPA: EamA family transporter [Chthoniobacterales bacterium]|nr:EamA family transporter [Chthoniobacterales bacterium]